MKCSIVLFAVLQVSSAVITTTTELTFECPGGNGKNGTRRIDVVLSYRANNFRFAVKPEGSSPNQFGIAILWAMLKEQTEFQAITTEDTSKCKVVWGYLVEREHLEDQERRGQWRVNRTLLTVTKYVLNTIGVSNEVSPDHGKMQLIARVDPQHDKILKETRNGFNLVVPLDENAKAFENKCPKYIYLEYEMATTSSETIQGSP